MDTLSRLLLLYPMRASLDVRCQFSAPWVIDHPPSAPHVAPYHLILAGHAWLDHADGTTSALTTGDVVLFPQGRAHRLHTGHDAQPAPAHTMVSDSVLQQRVNNGTGAVTEVLCGEFAAAPDAPNALLAALPETVIIRAGDTEEGAETAGLQHLIGMLRREAQSQRPGADSVISQLASVLFALLIRAWLAQTPTVSGVYALLAERRLQPLLHAMLTTPGEDWSLQRMAVLCHMSRATLARLFLQVAGSTPAMVLMQLRMAHAGALLRRGSVPVAVVGEAVGYQSEAAFNRVFKRHFGIAPGRYRHSATLP